jgi:hypothetical protein
MSQYTSPRTIWLQERNIHCRCIFKLTDTALKYVNQTVHVGGIFCNLAEAFDCVNHKI